MIANFSVVSLVNKEHLYRSCRESLECQAPAGTFDFIPINADAENLNAATAYNRGLEKAMHEFVIFVHQDVLFPKGWLIKAVAGIESFTSSAAVFGLVGVRSNGRTAGHISDPHGHMRWLPMPAKVISLDEHLIILRKSSGLRFDPENPGFHCYGADICLSARAKGVESWVIDAPVTHLSGGKVDDSFFKAADWLLAKHGRALNDVIPTCANLIYKKTLLNIIRLRSVRRNRGWSFSPANSSCDCGDLPRLSPQ